MDWSGARWHVWPRILAERLEQPREPLTLLLRPRVQVPAATLSTLAARALIGGGDSPLTLPRWLAPHQQVAAQRLNGILERYGGALLADAVGLGKSYVALAIALARGEPCALVVPAVLADQWRALLRRHDADASIVTHEALSRVTFQFAPPSPVRLFIVDEAHRFRTRSTRRYRALAQLVVGARVLLLTATPVHNRLDDLVSLFRLFLRDDALTALGIPSLIRAARDEVDGELLRDAVARMTVARSRERVQSGYAGGGGPLSLTFPRRLPGRVIRAGSLPDADLTATVAAIEGLAGASGTGALFRLLLLHRLSSSVAAFQESLIRYKTFLELAVTAGRDGLLLSPRAFQRLFPEREVDAFQLPLFPLLLAPGPVLTPSSDLALLDQLRAKLRDTVDPKAALLQDLLAAHTGKTIVFTSSRATARYLVRRLTGESVAGLFGDRGLLGSTPATRREVLRAFAPRAQEAPEPVASLETDILIATDVLSEGVNLQDAVRVVHYDLPWTPARLAQRVGRIDRLQSPHATIDSITFLPAAPLAAALRMEQRLAAKAVAQSAVSALVETVDGPADSSGLDWCDRLNGMIDGPAPLEYRETWAAVRGEEHAVVLVVRLGEHVEAIVVDRDGARSDPARATALLDAARVAVEVPATTGRTAIESAIERAAPLIRARLGAIADARWRAGDRDSLGRRLIQWVLAAARSAARQGDRARLGRLDTLVSRLAAGMTAGEELLLERLVERATPLNVNDLLRWDERLPPLAAAPDPPEAQLVAALCVFNFAA